MHLPEGYRVERLSRSEIPELIAAIATWHPDIAVGSASCYLREAFYVDKVFLHGESDNELLVLLIKRGIELAGFCSFEREPVDGVKQHGR